MLEGAQGGQEGRYSVGSDVGVWDQAESLLGPGNFRASDAVGRDKPKTDMMGCVFFKRSLWLPCGEYTHPWVILEGC